MNPARGLPTQLLAVAAIAISVVAWSKPPGPLRVDPGQIAEVESAYQTVRVVESLEPETVPAGGEAVSMPLYPRTVGVRYRFLRFDEDVDSYQSVLPLSSEAGPLTAARYYDHLALGLWFSGMPWAEREARAPRVLVIGHAGGTLARVVSAVAPKGGEPARVVGVEIDPAVVRLSRAHLEARGESDGKVEVVTGADGRTVIDALPAGERFDLIFVDAYQRTQYVPFQVTTVEFFRACVRHLTPGGAIGFNVDSTRGVEGTLLRSIASSLARALGEEGGGGVWLVPNSHYEGNVAVWGTRTPRAPRVSALVPASLSLPTFDLERLLVRHDPARDGGLVLTDDRAPTERLIDDAQRAEDPR